MTNPVFDVAIIGGGINGTGIARDAAGRNLSVFLCEQGDLASGTSSASTKLIHGGLRYLEYYEFRLVREALAEREVLLAAAPHIVWPIRFILPHHRHLRPAWLIRLGLFLYDHIGGRKRLPGSTAVDLSRDETGRVLRDGFTRGFEYSDCRVLDSRLTVLNAMDAQTHGARIKTRTKCLGAKRRDGVWQVDLQEGAATPYRIKAKILIDASGPWLDTTLKHISHKSSHDHIRMVKGSHIIVPKIFDHPKAYIFQNGDGRIIFAIPYENDFTLIGTTDVDFSGDPGQVSISESEKIYLCQAASEYFRNEVKTADIVHSYSGIRPLFDDGRGEARAVTRDYIIKLEDEAGQSPLLAIYGGKLTTYRKLAESVLAKLKPYLPQMSGPWTESAHLPGGDFLPEEFEQQVQILQEKVGFLPPDLARRLTRAYGTMASTICAPLLSAADMGRHFGKNLYAFEVEYLLRHEWARDADDILFRRTNLGLYFTEDQTRNLQIWIGNIAQQV